MMGSRYPEEKPYSFYDPEQDYEGLRLGPPRHKSTPVSPRGPISPRASQPEIYPPELNHGYYNRSRGFPSSPHEQLFNPYDVEQDLHERPRHGMDGPFRPSEAQLGYYNPNLQNPQELDNRSRGAGRGSPIPPLYVNPNSKPLPIPQGALPSGKYGPGAPSIDNYRQGASPSDTYGRGAPLKDIYARGTPPNKSYARGASSNDNYARGASPNESFAQGIPPNQSYVRGAPPNGSYARGVPLNDRYGQGTPPSDGYGRGTPPSDGYGRGAPPNDRYGQGTPPSDGYGRGTPPSDGYGRGAPPNDRYGQGTPPSDGYGRGAPPNDSYRPGTPPNDTYGRGSLESSYAGRGVSGRAPGTPGNSYGAPGSGTRPPYGEESFGYARGLGGRGRGVVPLGDGRYEYGGLHEPERLHMAEDYNGGASQPAPISSEYAHQVYASVFSDPVYGGARQLNSRAGYHEEPNSTQQAHHREDVRRHPDDF